jgi:hypothetical protein
MLVQDDKEAAVPLLHSELSIKTLTLYLCQQRSAGAQALDQAPC